VQENAGGTTVKLKAQSRKHKAGFKKHWQQKVISFLLSPFSFSP
jgi:hypothetical protein